MNSALKEFRDLSKDIVKEQSVYEGQIPLHLKHFLYYDSKRFRRGNISKELDLSKTSS